MVEVERHSDSAGLIVVVRGEIDGEVALASVIGNLPLEARIDTEGIGRMNSQGLRQWISYFQRHSEAGGRITYLHCSPAFTNHVSMIVSYCRGSQVESVIGPFFCPSCGTRLEKLIQTSSGLSSLKEQLKAQKCPKCGQEAQFDEVPQEYFSFLGAPAQEKG